MDELLIFAGGAIKATPDSSVIEGLLIPFGGPEDLDHDGEFFNSRTDLGLRLPAAVKLFYGHGKNAKVGRVPLAWAHLETQDDGVHFKADLSEDLEWLEEEREIGRKYQALTLQLAQEKALGASSGAAAHVVKKQAAEKGVWIARWPTAEASVTPRPANSRTFGRVALKALEDLPDPEEVLAALKGGPRVSLAERVEQFMDEGEALVTVFARLREAESRPRGAKIGRVMRASRLERFARAHAVMGEILAECAVPRRTRKPRRL